jgi:FAD/FMN-containing dehydrogenase
MPRARGRPTEQQSLLVAKEPFIAALRAACTASRRPGSAAERSVLAEDAFFRAAASLERFLSQWVVRCVSFDSSSFRDHVAERAANAAADALWRDWAPADRFWIGRDDVVVSVDLPIERKNALTRAAALLGWEDGNLPIARLRDFTNEARDILPAKYANRVIAFGPQRERLVDATFAIRNVIAHGSERSVTAMNQTLSSRQLPTGLQRGSRRITAAGVGRYLRSDGTPGRPRLEIFLDELAEVAHALAPRRGRKPVICP